MRLFGGPANGLTASGAVRALLLVSGGIPKTAQKPDARILQKTGYTWLPVFPCVFLYKSISRVQNSPNTSPTCSDIFVHQDLLPELPHTFTPREKASFPAVFRGTAMEIMEWSHSVIAHGARSCCENDCHIRETVQLRTCVHAM